MSEHSNKFRENIKEYSVSELAYSLKQTVEDMYGHVRVRGELGRVTIAKSGHCYLDLKDNKSVINSILWKGTMNDLTVKLEEGMAVICEGKLSTYPGRSNYQLIISSIQLAGEGALLALLEKRKKMFSDEGVFDSSKKIKLPYMPKSIGVITSPTGAVIQDILHRISERFPVNVILWPVLVQGDKAAKQISDAIMGFNSGLEIPRPDLLIVARGGGSIEDLWCFNEEIVVRSASLSKIPIISAVGHETDWTLMDYVADYRSPTPTGAGEKAVPVLVDLKNNISELESRLFRSLSRNIKEKKIALASSKLPRIDSILAHPQQSFDLILAKMVKPKVIFEPFIQKFSLISSKIPNIETLIDRQLSDLINLSSRLNEQPIKRNISVQEERVTLIFGRITNAIINKITNVSQKLSSDSQLLDAYSYQRVLDRGYVIVDDGNGNIIRTKSQIQPNSEIVMSFSDGKINAIISDRKEKIKKLITKKRTHNSEQTDLF